MSIEKHLGASWEYGGNVVTACVTSRIKVRGRDYPWQARTTPEVISLPRDSISILPPDLDQVNLSNETRS
jgi:hypothetical protein